MTSNVHEAGYPDVSLTTLQPVEIILVGLVLEEDDFFFLTTFKKFKQYLHIYIQHSAS